MKKITFLIGAYVVVAKGSTLRILCAAYVIITICIWLTEKSILNKMNQTHFFRNLTGVYFSIFLSIKVVHSRLDYANKSLVNSLVSIYERSIMLLSVLNLGAYYVHLDLKLDLDFLAYHAVAAYIK